MKAKQKWTKVIFLFLILGYSCSLSLSSKAQSIQQVNASYEVALPILGSAAVSSASQLHVLFTIEGEAQVSSIELLAGATPGTDEVKKMTFQLVQRNGHYFLSGSTGEFLVENGKAHLHVPMNDAEVKKLKYISIAAVSTAGVKSTYAWTAVK